MSITVVNTTNLPINSATNVANFNHSVHNAINPGEYYIHDTIPGTLYTLRARWFCGENAPYEQDILNLGLTVGGTLLSAVGLVVSALGVGASWATGGASLALSFAGAGISAAGEALAATSWGIHDTGVRASRDALWDTIPGQYNNVYKIMGEVPLKEAKDDKGNTIITSDHPNNFPLKIEKMDQTEFDRLRATNVLSQAGHPLHSDVKHLLNARELEPIEINEQTHATLSLNKRYWMENYHPGYHTGILGAHDDETDDRVYRVHKKEQQHLPEAQWQLIPCPPVAGRTFFVICERRFTKFLAATADRIVMVRTEDMAASTVNFANPGRPRFDLQLDPTKIDWTPTFDLMPASNGYYYLRPVYAGYHALGADNWFVSARDDDKPEIYKYQNHNEESYDQWKFVAVTD